MRLIKIIKRIEAILFGGKKKVENSPKRVNDDKKWYEVEFGRDKIRQWI